MKADAILKRIDENAKDVSSSILKEANLKAAQIQRDSHLRVEKLREQSKALAQHEANEVRKQMESIGELEFKKYLLVQKRSMLNETFDLAEHKLKQLPTSVVRKKVVAMILSQAQGGEELLLGKNAPEWFDESVFAGINTALEKQGKAALRLSAESAGACTGAVLLQRGIANNCSLEAILTYIRSDIENEVAAALFQQNP